MQSPSWSRPPRPARTDPSPSTRSTEAMEADNYAGDYAHGAALGVRAAAIEPHGEVDRFRVAALSGMGAELAGEYERADLLVREAISGADQLDDPPALVWASLVATMGSLGGAFADGLPYSTRAVAIARQRGLLSILPLALWAQATRLSGPGRFNLARSTAEEGISLASDFGHRSGVSWNLTERRAARRAARRRAGDARACPRGDRARRERGREHDHRASPNSHSDCSS